MMEMVGRAPVHFDTRHLLQWQPHYALKNKPDNTLPLCGLQLRSLAHQAASVYHTAPPRRLFGLWGIGREKAFYTPLPGRPRATRWHYRRL
jgi:hypothetical protein